MTDNSFLSVGQSLQKLESGGKDGTSQYNCAQDVYNEPRERHRLPSLPPDYSGSYVHTQVKIEKHLHKWNLADPVGFAVLILMEVCLGARGTVGEPSPRGQTNL
jgi:hypothetical protein